MVKTLYDGRSFPELAQSRVWPLSHRSYGSGCMDDRHAQHFCAHLNGSSYSLPRVLRPKMAGGSLGTVSAMEFALSYSLDGIEKIMSSACKRIVDSHEVIGLHTGPNANANEGTIDCKALDSFREIMLSIPDIANNVTVRNFCKYMLGGDFTENHYTSAIQSITTRIMAAPHMFDNYKGSVALRLSQAKSNLESRVIGDHDGVVIMITDTPEYVIDQAYIRNAANNKAGVFAINVAKIREYASNLFVGSDTNLLLHVAAVYHAATIDSLGGLVLPVERISI